MAVTEHNQTSEPVAKPAQAGTAESRSSDTPPTIEQLEQTIAELRAENKLLRYQLAIRLFPPETAPPFDPSEYQIVDPEEMLADLRKVAEESA
jgi:hypothetical protein